MPRRLIDMDIQWISTVDKGANGRTFAILKQAGQSLPASRPATFGEQVAIAKAAPTFAELLSANELRSWLPSALEALGQVINAALTAPDEEGITPEVRMQAALNAADEFRAGLLERVAVGIGKRSVAKRSARNGGSLAEAIL